MTVALSLFLSLCLLAAILYASAWISSAETAFFSLPSHQVNAFRKSKDASKQMISDLLAHPRDLLVTVFMVNTFTNILLQNIASDMFGERSGWLLKVGVPLVVTLILGEIIPKQIGLKYNVSIAIKNAKTLATLQKALSFLRRTVIAVAAPVSKIMFFYLKRESPIKREEIEYLLETSEKSGILQEDEASLLAGYINLQDKDVKELMSPKEDVLYYSLQDPLEKLIRCFTLKNASKITVCESSLENILGMLTALDYFYQRKRINKPADIITYLKPPLYVPETIDPFTLFKMMEDKQENLALVVNEYGNVSGQITKEDLFEVVVGPIADAKEPPLFIKAGENEVIASGKWELAEFNDYFDANLESNNHMVTLGGWLTEKLQEIPKIGGKHKLEGFYFHILEATPSRINRVFIKRVE